MASEARYSRCVFRFSTFTWPKADILNPKKSRNVNFFKNLYFKNENYTFGFNIALNFSVYGINQPSKKETLFKKLNISIFETGIVDRCNMICISLKRCKNS